MSGTLRFAAALSLAHALAAPVAAQTDPPQFVPMAGPDVRVAAQASRCSSGSVTLRVGQHVDYVKLAFVDEACLCYDDAAGVQHNLELFLEQEMVPAYESQGPAFDPRAFLRSRMLPEPVYDRVTIETQEGRETSRIFCYTEQQMVDYWNAYAEATKTAAVVAEGG